MKAVYEMPKVSFEAFIANNAVSSCTVRGAFDCVLGDGKGHEDFHGAEDQPKAEGLMASTAGLNGCTIQAGFADYINGQGQGEDSVGVSNPDFDNITTSKVYGNNIEYSGSTSHLAKNDGFMGWLYITLLQGWNSSGYFREYSDAGWSIDKSTDYDRLTLSNSNYISHAWLAPLFSTKSTSGM